MSYEFLGHETEVPFCPSAGAINGPNVESIKRLNSLVLASPLDFSRVASITFNGGFGNGPKHGRVYYHNPLTGQTINALGLPSINIETMEALYPELKQEADDRGKVVIPGVSSALGEDSLQVLPEMSERLAEVGADRIEVNYSCHNKVTEDGGREPVLAHDIERMIEVDQEILRRIGLDIWLIRKLAPLVGDRNHLIGPTTEYFAQAKGRVALSFNSLGGQSILTETGEPALDVPNNIGSLSGPATKLIGRSLLAVFRDRLPDSVQIDSPLGVCDGAEVYERIHNGGADFTSGTTIYFQNEEKGVDYKKTGEQIRDSFFEIKEQNFLIN